MVPAANSLEDALIDFFLARIKDRFTRLVGFANRVNCSLELSVEYIVHLGGIRLDLVHLKDRIREIHRVVEARVL